jgi:enoyl-CoA hydratase/carnithine racemase
MYDDLVRSCDELESDGDIRVIVLRGAGSEAFVAGTDITQFDDFKNGLDGVAYQHRISKVLDRVEAVRIPTVAAINGYAVGGGMALACACDLRVCTFDARFGVPIAYTLGNCLAMDTCRRLVHLLGASRAAQLLMLGSILTAQEALDAGFVARVGADLDVELEVICRQLLRSAPLTVAASKEALARIRRLDQSDGDDLVQICYGSDDFREGIRAFKEKRRPDWTGR